MFPDMRGIMMRLIFFLLISSAFACTDFVVSAKDGSLVNGRSLEFAVELQAELRIKPRAQKRVSDAPGQNGQNGQKPGVSWVSKYGYLGVFGSEFNFAFDGMNEAGLSFGYLWLLNVTEYPTLSDQDFGRALDFTDFCDWVLGNFSTVAEVKAALLNVRIWGHPIPQLGLAPVHAAIHDAKGNHLVVEFVGGQMQVYENPMSVLTNSPPFDWQIANLQNYLNLTPYNPNPTNFRGVTLQVPGQGSGLLGLPGDWSPPARFVKMITFLRFVQGAATHEEAINLAEHLLNTVDIPKGTVRDPDKDSGDYTQWIIIKDLTQKGFYFRSYRDLALKKVDLKKLDFTKETKKGLPLDLKRGYFDVTDSFRGKKESMTVMKEELQQPQP